MTLQPAVKNGAWAIAIVAAAGLVGINVALGPSERPRAPRQAAAAIPAPVAAAAGVAEGTRLFVAYNCGDCHGAGGSGAMGPSLQDNRWRFGGSDPEVYRSIAEGRPEGMPAWGPLVPADHVRQLVAYIRTLGVGKDLTTENFTGATVERTGH